MAEAEQRASDHETITTNTVDQLNIIMPADAPRVENSDQEHAEAINVISMSIAEVNSKLKDAGLPELNDTRGRSDVIDAMPMLGLDRTARTIALGAIAIANRAEGAVYRDDSVSAHTGEDDIERTWRKSINSLRDMEHMPKINNDMGGDVYLERAHVSDLAHNILRKLASSEIANDEVLDQIEFAATAALDFTPLPASNRDQIIESIEARSSDRRKRAWDRERVDYMIALRDQYRGKIYAPTSLRIAMDNPDEANFLGEDGDNYLILVLELRDEGSKDTRSIAIAERVVSYTEEHESAWAPDGAIGAIYSYEETADTAGIWQEVFGLSKKEAIELGAIKTTHTGDFDVRLREKLALR